MQPPPIFLSVSPGPLVDKVAVQIAALRSGNWLAAFGIGVRDPIANPWLKQQLALRLGIVSNLSIDRMDTVFEGAIANIAPHLRLATRADLELSILEQLCQDELHQTSWTPVLRFLETAHTSDAIDAKRTQLAERLSRLYLYYASHRPRWVLERILPIPWQQALLDRILEPVNGVSRRLMPQILVEVPGPWPSNHHCLFAVSPHTEVEAEAIYRLQLPVLSLTPREVPSPNVPIELGRWFGLERKAERLRDAFDVNLLPTRRDVEGSLGQLQAEIMGHSEPWEPLEPRECEDSHTLTLLRSKNHRESAEWIASTTFAWLEADNTLQLSDIAIIHCSSHPIEHRVAVEAALAEQGLPVHEVDAPVSEKSASIELLKALLELPNSKRSRQDLLQIMTHPLVQKRFGTADPTAWHQWCDALNIFFGEDHRSHQETYIESDHFHWAQGLTRLGLGAFMGSPRDGFQPVETRRDPCLPLPLREDEWQSAGLFVALAEGLLDDAQYLSQLSQNLTEWSSTFSELVLCYFGQQNEQDARDQRLIQSVLQEIVGENGQIGYPEASALVRKRLERRTSSRGPPLAEAMVAGRLEQLAWVPFRKVILLGLENKAFPKTSNLQVLSPKADGFNHGLEATERDQSMAQLLTRIIQTQESLHCVVVDRTPAGELKPIGSALSELLELSRRAGIPWTEVSAPSPRYEPGITTRVLDREKATGVNYGEVSPRIHLSSIRRLFEEPINGWLAHRLRLYEASSEGDLSSEPFELPKREFLSVPRAAFFHWASRNDASLEDIYTRMSQQRILEGGFPVGPFGDALRLKHQAVLRAWQQRWIEATDGVLMTLRWFELGRPGPPETGGALRPSVPLGDGRFLVGTTVAETENGSIMLTEKTPSRVQRMRLELYAWLSQLALQPERPATDRWQCTLVSGDGQPLVQTQFEAQDGPKLLHRITLPLFAAAPNFSFPWALQLRLAELRMSGASHRSMSSILQSAVREPLPLLPWMKLPTLDLESALAFIETTVAPFLETRRETH